MAKENWKQGKTGDCVVSDTGEEPTSGEWEYYGGILVCESIRKKEDKNLIIAAPELLETLTGVTMALSRMIDKYDPDSIEAEWIGNANEVIRKAKGE